MLSLTGFFTGSPGVAPRKAYTLVMEVDPLSRVMKRDLQPPQRAMSKLI